MPIQLSAGNALPPHRPRIETQIHRRKKAKAYSPLEPEWEQLDPLPPVHLRMPADRMLPTSTTRPKKPV